MYIYQKQILLKETDATGVLFFSEQLNFALEAMESYFLSRGFTLSEMLKGGKFAMPIVHAETDFFSPLRVGEMISIELACEKVGTKSFTMATQVKDSNGSVVGTTKIVHVCLSLQSGASIPIPEIVLVHLREF